MGSISGAEESSKESIGQIKKIRGQVFVDTIKDGSEVSVEAKQNMALFEQDTVRTVGDSQAMIIFIDESSMNVLQDSACKLNSFKIKPKGKGSIFSSAFDLMSGKIRLYMNHAIKGERDAKVNTSSAVMGIRGTDIFVSTIKGVASMACVSCDVKKAPTIASLSNLSKAVSLVNGKMAEVKNGDVGQSFSIPADYNKIITSSMSNSSHKYGTVKSVNKDRDINPRVVLETPSNKDGGKAKGFSQTETSLLENYDGLKAKAQYEADKQELKKQFKQKNVDIKIKIE